MVRQIALHPRVSRFLLFLALSVAGLILLVKASFLLDDAPYRMTLTPFQGRGKVQFFEPGKRYVSAEFEVDYPFQKPHVIILDSGYVVIPGGAIEFYDASPLPGRFQIRIGGTLFDVMEEHIFINGHYHAWIQM
jgi:hypothetical protein